MSGISPVKLFKVILLSIVLLSVTCYSQENQKTYKILGVSIEGNKETDPATIIAQSGLKIGDEIQVPGDQTLNAIRQLWTLGIFSDVQILIDREIPEGVFLLIKVKEYPRLEKVELEGNKKLKKDDRQK